MRTTTQILTLLAFVLITKANAQIAELKPEIQRYEPFTWESEAPDDCPFKQSKELTGIKFLGIKSGYHYGDAWYPTWASNDTLYSPWTDGKTKRIDGYKDNSQSYGVPAELTTGQRTGHGWDPLWVSELLKITVTHGRDVHIHQQNHYLASQDETAIRLK